jgi:(2Fe-2S) ferredoxin
MPDSFYRHHVFVCQNRRDDGRRCCADFGSTDIRAYAKEKLKTLGAHGRGKVRINQCGCLDRCEEGPVMVVYPDETWYTYVDREDVDEIIDQHLLNGRVVERLKI